MVLEIFVELMKPKPKPPTDDVEGDGELDVVPKRYYPKPNPHELFTVHVDSRRILTVSTGNEVTATKWLAEVLKSTVSNAKPLKQHSGLSSDVIFVGLVADNEEDYYTPAGAFQEKNQNYGLLTLCVGSHCLMYNLPWCGETPKPVKAFFQNPKVVVLCKGIADVAKKLKKLHGIEIKSAVDLNELAVRGMKREDLDLGRYDLKRLAMTVLGKHYDVIRPEEDEIYRWWRTYYDEGSLEVADRRRLSFDIDRVKFSTVDAYLSLLIGTELFEAMYGFPLSSTARATRKKNTTKKSK